MSKAVIRLDGEAVLSVELRRNGSLEYRGTDAVLLGWFHWVLENWKDEAASVGAGKEPLAPIRPETFHEFVNLSVNKASFETENDYWYDLEDMVETDKMRIPDPPDKDTVY